MAEQRGNYFSYQKRVTTSNSLDRNRFLFSKSSTDLQAIICIVHMCSKLDDSIFSHT
jgi:hypothetical protein